jgi:hypothetical protein
MEEHAVLAFLRATRLCRVRRQEYGAVVVSQFHRVLARLGNPTHFRPRRTWRMPQAQVMEKRRLRSPATTPQALAWDGQNNALWMGSRDLRHIYAIDPQNGTVLKQQEAPGIPWAAVALNGELRFTIGEDPDDDRYIYRYTAENGFSKMFACPDFTGSYLSFDGEHLYMSQWYKKRVLKFDHQGKVVREIDVGAEICGHSFAHGTLYVVCGQEQPDENWRIVRVNLQEKTPIVEDIAIVPFASRSLTFDGELFWSNHRAKDMIISFALPN